MMEYRLSKRVLGSKFFINLTEAEYNELLSARNNILIALYLEEAFDVLIDNYLEFETTLLQSAFAHLVRFTITHKTLQAERRLFNRKMINLLSTSRSYLDQAEHHFSNIFGDDSTESSNIKKKRSDGYDNCLGYRVMEALRNHVQHNGWPIHSVTIHSKLVGEVSNGKILWSVTPYINVKALEENPKFKKKVLNELKKLGDNIDVKPLIREYMEVLADIHNEVRTTLRSHIQKWEELILGAINRFQEESQDKNALGLVLVASDDDNTHTSASIFKELVESRRELENKNHNLVNLSKRYVTNEIIEK